MPPSTSVGLVREIAALIDHTLLKPQATGADIRRLCQEARLYGFATVCVNPYWVGLAASELAGSPVQVAAVAGFPLGANTTAIKVAETEAVIAAGAFDGGFIPVEQEQRAEILGTGPEAAPQVVEILRRVGALR